MRSGPVRKGRTSGRGRAMWGKQLFGPWVRDRRLPPADHRTRVLNIQRAGAHSMRFPSETVGWPVADVVRESVGQVTPEKPAGWG